MWTGSDWVLQVAFRNHSWHEQRPPHRLPICRCHPTLLIWVNTGNIIAKASAAWLLQLTTQGLPGYCSHHLWRHLVRSKCYSAVNNVSHCGTESTGPRLHHHSGLHGSLGQPGSFAAQSLCQSHMLSSLKKFRDAYLLHYLTPFTQLIRLGDTLKMCLCTVQIPFKIFIAAYLRLIFSK